MISLGRLAYYAGVMVKTFVASVLIGAAAAVLGWLVALFFEGSMSEAAFADLRFGWAGSLIGGTALLMLLLMWYFSEPKAEPLVAAVCAAIGAALLWDHRELPFNTAGFNRTSDNYWLAVTMMGLMVVVVLLGLRAARESNKRLR